MEAGLKPKQIVQAAYPGATCKRMGWAEFRVFASGKCLGHGGLPFAAWANALKTIKNVQSKTAN